MPGASPGSLPSASNPARLSIVSKETTKPRRLPPPSRKTSVPTSERTKLKPWAPSELPPPTDALNVAVKLCTAAPLLKSGRTYEPRCGSAFSPFGGRSSRSVNFRTPLSTSAIPSAVPPGSEAKFALKVADDAETTPAKANATTKGGAFLSCRCCLMDECWVCRTPSPNAAPHALPSRAQVGPERHGTSPGRGCERPGNGQANGLCYAKRRSYQASDRVKRRRSPRPARQASRISKLPNGPGRNSQPKPPTAPRSGSIRRPTHPDRRHRTPRSPVSHAAAPSRPNP